MRLRIGLLFLLSIAALPGSAGAQTAPSWHIMQDGVAFFTWNHQGGSRGGTDFGVQNWWMGMAERPAGGGKIRFNLMLSVDPASLWKVGCVRAAIAETKPSGDPWDTGIGSATAPDPLCTFWLGNSSAAETSVLMNTFAPAWNESITPTSRASVSTKPANVPV